MPDIKPIFNHKNPFDLSAGRPVAEAAPSATRHKKVSITQPAIASGAPIIKSKKYTASEIREMLKGYARLQKDKWASLRIGQRIRYVRAVGNVFVQGGVIIGLPVRDGRPGIKMDNGKSASAKDYASWITNIDDIGIIFIKQPAAAS